MQVAAEISPSNKLSKISIAFDCICRCCLANEVLLKPIFNSVESIAENIFLLTAVNVTKDDGFPGYICINCLQQLNGCISFKRKVEAADLYLQKYLTNCAHIVGEADAKSLGNNSEDKPSVEGNGAALDNTLANEMAISSNGVYKCTECRRSYGSRSAYNRHIKGHELKDNDFRCSDCGKRFTDKGIFEDHQVCHTQKRSINFTSPEGMFTCQICKETFGVEQDLFIHSSLHEVAEKISCRGCGKDFENLGKLKRHVPRHFKEKPFKCNRCEMGFPEMASLTRHYRKHTGRKQTSSHICTTCNRNFPNQYTLKVHERNHTGERPWECTNCNKRFTDYRLLNSHKKLHEEGKPYECRKCQNRFRHHTTLTSHMRIHTGDRPHRCDKCKKSYKQSWCLRIHKRTHEDKKRFLCDQCSQLFSTYASLKSHLRWHSDQVVSDDQNPQAKTSSESFQCKECSIKCPSRLDLISHEKLTHALSHECDTCFGKWKTLEELVQHKCDEAIEVSEEPTSDEMILLPNGEIQDCYTVVNALLSSISHPSTATNDKATAEQA